MTKAEKSRNLRYKKPALAELGYEQITCTLEEIRDVCYDIHWAADDDETLYAFFDNNDEEMWEFKMLFTTLEAEAEYLYNRLLELNCYEDEYQYLFDNCTVALIGDRFKVVGYDDYEEDYFSLTSFESGLAVTEAGKRIMRMTKAEMITTIGQCLGVVISFLNIQQKYDYLKATLDIIRDENNSILQCVKEIEAAYEKANDDKFCECDKSTQEFDRLINELPDRFWVE